MSRTISIRILIVIIILAGLFVSTPPRTTQAAGRCYVNDDAAGSNTGTDWANAYISLQSALADTCTEIWVAAGIYKPHVSDPEISFDLKSGVAIYGGFSGTETLLSERDYQTNITILSGDLNGDDLGFLNNDENTCIVTRGIIVNGTAVLDGFTISGGNSRDSIKCSSKGSNGGGMFNYQGSPTLANLIINTNSAYSGGGIHNLNHSSPTLTNVTIKENMAEYGDGGGMFNDFFSSPTLTNVRFHGNTAYSSGGGMENNNNSNPTLTNITFSNNNAHYGGGIYNSTFTNSVLTNVTFSGNSAHSGGGILNSFYSNATLINVTFSGNSASHGYGAGMQNSHETNITLTNVIIANSIGGGDCVNDGGIIDASSSNNLIENTSSACGLVNGANGNIIGFDPNLGPLASNGGYTQTHALLANSLAIDAGTNSGCPTSDQRGVLRPQGSHCDIGAVEYVPPIFADVPYEYWAWEYIESLYSSGITGGCSTSPLNYCPNNQVTRTQMAVFLLRGIHDSSYTPPAATGTVFNDVGAGDFAAAWIEQMISEGITSGCGGGNYCPDGFVTRAQMAVFLLRAKYDSGYTPPAATGTVFTDVGAGDFAAAWIEQMVSEGITTGCGGGNYCPNEPVTRAQMAVFLVRVFNLP